MVQMLSKLFKDMVTTERKYVDPREVLKAIFDDEGKPQPFGVGLEKDITEFTLNFLERVEEGFGESESSN
jgi:hypothetical protein